MEGAYDVMNVVKDFLYENVTKGDENPYKIHYLDVTNIAKPGLVVLTLAGYCEYTTDRSLPSLLNNLFYKLACTGITPIPLCKIEGVKYSDVIAAL